MSILFWLVMMGSNGTVTVHPEPFRTVAECKAFSKEVPAWTAKCIPKQHVQV